MLLTLASAVRTFVVPRSDNVFLTRFVFQALYYLFLFRLRWTNSYAQRDRIMAYFAPVGLLLMPIVWVTSVMIGYMAMF